MNGKASFRAEGRSFARLPCVESGALGLAENAQILKVKDFNGPGEAHGESDTVAGIADPALKRSCVVSVRPAHFTRFGVMVRVNGQVAEDADGNGAQATTPLNGSSSLSSASGSSWRPAERSKSSTTP